jgi:predicted CoA-binding protein
MTTQTSVQEFLSQKKLAVFGVSLSGKKFGNAILKDLSAKGYNIFGINPKVEKNGEKKIYTNLASLPEKVDGIITVVPPKQTEMIVKEVAEQGITQVWMQQGSESESAIEFCKNEGMNVVSGECILMFSEPVGFLHKFHGWIWKLLGKYPK